MGFPILVHGKTTSLYESEPCGWGEMAGTALFLYYSLAITTKLSSHQQYLHPDYLSRCSPKSLPPYIDGLMQDCSNSIADALELLHTSLSHWCVSSLINVRRPSYLGFTRSISWLLMPWLLSSPEHQQPWYWLCRIGRSLSYLRKDFNYLCHINVEKWHKI